MNQEPTIQPSKPVSNSSRSAAFWTSSIVFLLLLIVLSIFVLQNNNEVELQFLNLGGQIPLAVAMLLSAVVGGLLVALLGSIRIMQVKRRS